MMRKNLSNLNKKADISFDIFFTYLDVIAYTLKQVSKTHVKFNSDEGIFFALHRIKKLCRKKIRTKTKILDYIYEIDKKNNQEVAS